MDRLIDMDNAGEVLIYIYATSQKYLVTQKMLFLILITLLGAGNKICVSFSSPKGQHFIKKKGGDEKFDLR